MGNELAAQDRACDRVEFDRPVDVGPGAALGTLFGGDAGFAASGSKGPARLPVPGCTGVTTSAPWGRCQASSSPSAIHTHSRWALRQRRVQSAACSGVWRSSWIIHAILRPSAAVDSTSGMRTPPERVRFSMSCRVFLMTLSSSSRPCGSGAAAKERLLRRLPRGLSRAEPTCP